MNIKIGINPIGWSNDDLPQLGGEISLDTCLSEGARVGYQGFELGNKFPSTASSLQPLLDSYQLKMVSCWQGAQLLINGVEQEKKNLKENLTLHQQMGCEVMVFAEVSNSVQTMINVPLKNRPQMNNDQWKTLISRLNEIAKYLTDQGLKMAYHHHMGTVIETSDDIKRLMNETIDDVGLLVDTGHIFFAGGDVLQLINDYASRVVHIHCKDVREVVMKEVLNRNVSFLDAVIQGVFTVPGDGDVNFKSVIDSLDQINYQGWLVVEAEQDPCVAPPMQYAQFGYDTLSQLLKN